MVIRPAHGDAPHTGERNAFAAPALRCLLAPVIAFDLVLTALLVEWVRPTLSDTFGAMVFGAGPFLLLMLSQLVGSLERLDHRRRGLLAWSILAGAACLLFAPLLGRI